MAKNHLRALRRHHLARIKNRRLDYYGGYIRELSPDQRARHVGRLAHTAKSCSCWMCGNPRRHEQGPTMQERRFGGQERLGWDMNDRVEE